MIDTANQTDQKQLTEETRMVEDLLKNAGFARVDAYRYNSASIRLRVIDPRFEGLTNAKRDDLVEPVLEQLPERTQGDILMLYTFAPSELELQVPGASQKSLRHYLQNMEFDDPSESMR